MGDGKGARCLALEPLVFRLRYASQVIQLRSHYLHPGSYRPFKIIQGNTIALAHSDGPYMQKYEKFIETRFHELEHEPKMREDAAPQNPLPHL